MSKEFNTRKQYMIDAYRLYRERDKNRYNSEEHEKYRKLLKEVRQKFQPVVCKEEKFLPTMNGGIRKDGQLVF